MSSAKNFNKKNRFLSIIYIPVIACLSACALLYTLSHFIERSFEEYVVSQNIIELHSVIDSIERELSYYSSSEDRNDLIQNILLILASHHRLFVHIVDNKNNILYKTRGPDLLVARKYFNLPEMIAKKSTAIWEHEHYSYRIAASQFSGSNGTTYTIIAAVGRNIQLEFIKRLHNGLLLLIIISCVLILFGTLLTIYFTQKPINKLIKKIESINTKSLDYRIPTSSVPAKYICLVEAFNSVVARMEDIFNHQNNFTADLAHEMRTPITNLTTQTQIALNNARTDEEYREILYSNLEEFERLSQIITNILFLAQAENKQLIPQLTEIDLIDMFTVMFEYFEPLSEDKNIILKLEGNCNHIAGDKLMIRRTIGNLLSNAIRHTPENNIITVTLSQLDNQTVKIIMANPGEKVNARHLPHLFDRFYRTDESRQRNGEGAGIGLAIVKSIVEAHKGRIDVESDDDSTRFIITLPSIHKSKKENNHSKRI